MARRNWLPGRTDREQGRAKPRDDAAFAMRLERSMDGLNIHGPHDDNTIV